MPVDYSYNLVAENRHSTVVAKYPPENVGRVREKRTEYYQSEAALEPGKRDADRKVSFKEEFGNLTD